MASEKEDEDMFHTAKLQWKPKEKIHGSLVSLVVGSNVLCIGTHGEKSWIIRWNVDTEEYEEINIPRSQPSDRIRKVFMNGTGDHTIVSFASGTNYYINARPKQASRAIILKKAPTPLCIESVAWNTPFETPTNTKAILIGTNDGKIYETSIEEKDKAWRQCIDLDMDKKAIPISGLRIELVPDRAEEDVKHHKYVIIASTKARQYQFTGGPTFEAIFAKYVQNMNQIAFKELPNASGTSGEMRFFAKSGGSGMEPVTANGYVPSQLFAWLTGPGVYFGDLNFEFSSLSENTVAKMIKLISFPVSPATTDTKEQTMRPVSLALTEFHILLLSEHRLVAINRLSDLVVYDQVFDTSWGTMKTLAPDPVKNNVFLLSDKFVFEVEINDEERDVWKLYLEKKEFDRALAFSNTRAQHEQVLNAHADYLYSKEIYDEAAKKYANTKRSFEEITLKFVNTPGALARTALKTYLMMKLYSLPHDDRVRQTLICTWLVEIFLSNIDTLSDAVADAEAVEKRASTTEELEAELRVFRTFLENQSDCLNKATTFELLSAHGRTDELIYFAKLCNPPDLDFIVSHYMREKNYSECLHTLFEMKESAKQHADIFYKFAPMLIQHVPTETVNMLLQLGKDLEPIKLIPALMRYEATRPANIDTKQNEAIRYLQHFIYYHDEKKKTIHNFLFTLLVKQRDDKALLDFIKDSKTKQRGIRFDYKYALRLCHTEKKPRAMVAIYRVMRHYEEAVRMALEVDLQEAKAIVEESDSKEEKKKLWLLIACHVISQVTAQNGDVAKAIAVLKECPDYLQLEDILPFFPDFAEIGQFKTEIVESLQNYTKNITDLKHTMEGYTSTAAKIQKDIAELNKRSGVVKFNQKCDHCGLHLLTQQFYYYPCTHAFHVSCVEEELRKYLSQNKSARAMEEAHMRDSTLESKTKTERKVSGKLNETAVLEELATELGLRECMFCNAVMIDSVQRPFIDKESVTERNEAHSWDI